MWEKAIIHSYIHNCYAQIEEIMFPILKEKAMVVVDNQKVISLNSLAMDYSIKLGESLMTAQQKCLDLTVVSAHYNEYRYYFEEVKNIYREYSDKVEGFESEMWVDITASQGLFGGHPVDIAKEIQERIYHELGLCVVMGVSFNKLFAKLANRSHEQLGLSVISRRHYKRDVYPLPLQETPYLDRDMIEKLNHQGIYTVGGIAYSSLDELKLLLGHSGEYLWNLVHGINMDEDQCSIYENDIQMIGKLWHYSGNVSTYEGFSKNLKSIILDIAYRLDDHGMKGKKISICMYDNQMNCHITSKVLSMSANDAMTIRNVADMLLREYCLNAWNGQFYQSFQCMMFIVSDLSYEDNDFDLKTVIFQKDRHQEKVDLLFMGLRDKFALRKLKKSLG